MAETGSRMVWRRVMRAAEEAADRACFWASEKFVGTVMTAALTFFPR